MRKRGDLVAGFTVSPRATFTFIVASRRARGGEGLKRRREMREKVVIESHQAYRFLQRGSIESHACHSACRGSMSESPAGASLKTPLRTTLKPHTSLWDFVTYGSRHAARCANPRVESCIQPSRHAAPVNTHTHTHYAAESLSWYSRERVKQPCTPLSAHSRWMTLDSSSGRMPCSSAAADRANSWRASSCRGRCGGKRRRC